MNNKPLSISELLTRYTSNSLNKSISKSISEFSEKSVLVEIKQYLPKNYRDLCEVKLIKPNEITIFSAPGGHITELYFFKEELLTIINDRYPTLQINQINTHIHIEKK